MDIWPTDIILANGHLPTDIWPTFAVWSFCQHPKNILVI